MPALWTKKTDNYGGAMIEWGGWLYCGKAVPLTIARTQDLASFDDLQAVVGDGIKSFAVLGSYLYASAGTQVWRTSDGTTWAVAKDLNDFVLGTFLEINRLKVWDGKLYAACRVGKKTPTVDLLVYSSNGTAWTAVSEKFGTADNTVNYCFDPTDMDGKLTVSIADLGQIWNSPDGTTWTLRDTFSDAPGFAVNLGYFNGKYVATWDSNSALVNAQVYSSLDGVTWGVEHSFAAPSAVQSMLEITLAYLWVGHGTGNVSRTADYLTWEDTDSDGTITHEIFNMGTFGTSFLCAGLTAGLYEVPNAIPALVVPGLILSPQWAGNNEQWG